MASLITCAGADVQSGRISLGLRGPWWAELKIATDTPPAGKVTIAADNGGLSLVGTVIAAGEFRLTTTVRIVGGAGGLGTEVMGAFQSAQLRDPLAEIMRASGETLSTTIDEAVLSVPLARWTLGRASAARCLDELADAAAAHLGKSITWRVLADGTTWMGAETWPAEAMPDDAVISESFPAEGRTVIGCATPSLLPGVNLDGVGLVRGVDHYIEPDRIRSHVWDRDQDPIGRLVSMVLGALGVDYQGAPRLDRLALYRARVDAASSDGATVDVVPESPRLERMQRVPLRYAPGCTATVKRDAVVLLGWEAGDPARVYATPLYEAGATFSKLVFGADAIEVGGDSFSLPKLETLLGDLKALVDDLATVLASNCVNGSPLAGWAANPTIATRLVALSANLAGAKFKSTVVKNG